MKFKLKPKFKFKITTGRKILDYLIIVAVLSLFVVVGMYASHTKKTLKLSRIEVNIEDLDKHNFMSVEDVMSIVDRQSIKINEVLCSNIDVRTLKQIIGAMPCVKSAKCYVGYFSGVLYIDIEQVEPMFRIIDRDGKSYYVDQDGHYVLKNNSRCYNIPVVTNNYPTLFNSVSKKSAQKGDNIEKLVTFVKYINEDDVLASLITQINVTESAIVEVIPCVGKQTIVLGNIKDLDSISVKMYKIKAFYKEGKDLGLIDKYKKIDISHNNQIICTY